MRIDKALGYESQALKQAAASAAKQQSGQAAPADAQGTAEGVEVVQSNQALIQAAKGADEVNRAAVEEAKALIASGQLDTPDRIRAAAQNMVDLGM